MESALYDNNLADHYHFYDETTGELLDIPRESVTFDTMLDPTFQVSSVEVLLRGTRSA
ncbi:hypothetical protein D3C86_1361940 [compost metagenome]